MMVMEEEEPKSRIAGLEYVLGDPGIAGTEIRQLTARPGGVDVGALLLCFLNDSTPLCTHFPSSVTLLTPWTRH